jgi:transposase
MSVPTVHLNGTSQEELVSLRLDVVEAIRDAVVALRKAAPHGRDYYVQGPDAYNTARLIWEGRLAELEGVAERIRAEALDIADQ